MCIYVYVLISNYPLKLVKALFTCWTLIKLLCSGSSSASRTSQTEGPSDRARCCPKSLPRASVRLLGQVRTSQRTIQAFSHFCLPPHPACLGKTVLKTPVGGPFLCLIYSGFCDLS